MSYAPEGSSPGGRRLSLPPGHRRLHGPPVTILKLGWLTRGALRLSALLLIVVLVVLLFAPAACAFFIAYPIGQPNPPSGSRLPVPPYEDVSFPSAIDGAHLSGWYLPSPTPQGRTVIISHGFRNDRLVHGRGLPLAQVLRERGFDVLLFDLRGQGKSGGGPVTLGAREQWDVAGAIRYARARGAQHIGLMGFSIGATASLLVAAGDPGVDAVVADSALTDLHEYLEAQVMARSHLGRAYAEYALLWYRWATRSDERTVRPVEAIGRLASRPVLLIHATGDRVIPAAESEKLLATAAAAVSTTSSGTTAAGGPVVQLWLVSGTHHTHSYEVNPEAYAAKVAGFLDDNVR